MTFPEQYRTELLNAIQGIHLEQVNEAIGMFMDARAHGRCIFVCAIGSHALAASRLLCDTVKLSTRERSARFRIVALSEDLGKARSADGGLPYDGVFVEQLRNIAECGDVVVGISVSGNNAAILRAFEYARRAGCGTICITGRNADKLAALSNVAILAPASHPGSVEDIHMIICHMIGYSFVNLESV